MEINDIRTARSIISKLDKRNDIEHIRLSLYSVLISILLSKELFNRNTDIKILLEKMNLEYKDYVYKSRTLIVARVIRSLEKASQDELNLYLEICKSLLFPNLNKKINAPNKNINSIDELLIQFKRG